MRTIISALWLCLAAGGLVAAEPPPFTPRDDKHPTSTHFPDIQSEARRINHLVRDYLVVPTPDGFPKADVAAFGRRVRADAGGKMPDAAYPKLSEQLLFFEETLAGADSYPVSMPLFVSQRSSTERAQVYFFTGNDHNEGKIPLEGATAKIETLNSLEQAIEPYQINAKRYTAHQVRLQLLELAGDWDAYFETGRPQTFVDIVATTLFEYHSIRKDYLTPPPSRQWFLFHPNVVLENLDAAPDGDQLGGAVAIEWIGVNWWKGAGFMKIPFGISLTSLYSDRPGVSDVGHGVSVYLANKYCIGWANHGGHHGFYVSIDALKLIDSKKRKLDQYRQQLGQRLNLGSIAGDN